MDFRKLAIYTMITGSLVAGVSIGTRAIYQTNLSENEIIHSSMFQVGMEKVQIQKASVPTIELAPGKGGVYEFWVNKTGTSEQIDVALDIEVKTTGELGVGSPVTYQLVKTTGNTRTEYTDPLKTTNDIMNQNIESYAVEYMWGENGENDNQYAGKTATIEINVLAKQVVEKELNTTGWSQDDGNKNNIKAEFKGGEGTEATFYFPSATVTGIWHYDENQKATIIKNGKTYKVSIPKGFF